MKAPVARIAFGAVFLMLAGCGSILAPQPDQSRFFILTAVAAANPAPAPGLHAGARRIKIGLGPVEIPAYLSRSEIATRVAPNRLDYSATDHWAEPFDTNFRRVLTANLAAMLDDADILALPSYETSGLNYRIAINVERFERTAAGGNELAAHWTIRGGDGTTTLIDRESILREPAKSGTTVDAVAALSASLGDLCGQIATALRQLNERRGAGPPKDLAGARD